jgi:hypothetical protein
MLKEKSWEEFKESGMLWWINTTLHTFGWAIVYETDETSNIIRAYPARCKFRGFSKNTNTEGYQKISKYMLDNAEELFKEANE